MNTGLYKRQVSTLEHLGILQTAFADSLWSNWITLQKPNWCIKKKALYILPGLKEVYSLENQIKLFWGQIVNPFACRTLQHRRTVSVLLNFFSQIQAYHSIQSARLWLSGILKILFVEEWTVSNSLFDILNTKSHIVNSVFLVSQPWVWHTKYI